MSIEYIVSTHKDYYIKTLPKLLMSFKEAGVKASSIHVFVGGSENKEENILGVRMTHVGHNSFDYTGFVEIAHNGSDKSHLFFMHDTCSVGPEFQNLVSAMDGTELKVVSPVTAFPFMCNIGLVRTDYVKKLRIITNSMKGCSKSQAVMLEGQILTMTSKEKVGFFANSEALPRSDGKWEAVYRDGVRRTTEHYYSIDLYKYKANCNISSNWVIGA